tara:strand:+ start:102 stop:644 length:543 start_codon:yes stop_codon:yes gene_type:complete
MIFSSDLKEWINKKTDLINKNSYKMSFNYSVSKNKKNFNQESLEAVTFYCINPNSSIISTQNRVTFFYKDYTEIIDLSSKQKIIQSSDSDFDNLKMKLSSIFTGENFRIIKISKSKYLLSLNDYYMNMNIIYNNDNPYITDLSFYQAPYWIHVKDLSITFSDSIPYDDSIWGDYEVFDFR